MAASMRSMMNNTKKYILWCANEHLDFRIPEIQSIASIFNLPMKYTMNSTAEPYILADMEYEHVNMLMSRSILIRSAYEFWAVGSSYSQLHHNLKSLSPDFLKTYQDENKSFRMRVEAYGKKLTADYKLRRINELDFLEFEGPVNLTNADNSFYLLEFYGPNPNPNEASDQPELIFFGRWVSNGQRAKISELSLKKRKFIGNTSMDAGLSLIMANQACVKKNSIVLDPFVGSGSLLVAAAQCGAYVLGTDIDYLTVHGLGKPTRYNQVRREADESILCNLRQYNLESQYLDIIVADASRPLWKDDFKVDAIITDPPYGIREATERVGTKKRHKIKNQQLLGHIPSRIDYNLTALLADLLNFSAKYLTMNGRLVYWLPVFKEDYSEECIPTHPCLKLISNSEQELAEHSSRRLITMEKVSEYISEKAQVHENADNFRNRYFQAVRTRMMNANTDVFSQNSPG